MDFFAFVKPKNELENSAEKQQNVPFVPEAMWVKCPKCNALLLTTDMEENLHVCTHCNHHFRMSAKQRIALLADKETFREHDADLTSSNLLDFPGYDEKLEKAKKKGKRVRPLRRMHHRRHPLRALRDGRGFHDGQHGHRHGRKNHPRL